ncbi:MAG TPA: hypothetical protein VGC42_27535, partial [Kofleriaceae bacterium]
PFVVIGHPTHRRVTLFQAALAAQGLAPARVIAWAELAVPGAPARLISPISPGTIVRIDSAGEDDAIDRLLIARGAAAARGAGCAWIAADAARALPV